MVNIFSLEDIMIKMRNQISIGLTLKLSIDLEKKRKTKRGLILGKLYLPVTLFDSKSPPLENDRIPGPLAHITKTICNLTLSLFVRIFVLYYVHSN